MPVPATATTPGIAVETISLDLSVHTKHNKPVRDLQPAELAITDGGTPVQLSAFHLVARDSEPQHLVRFVFDRLNAGTAKTARRMAEKSLGEIPEKGSSIAVFQVNGCLRPLQTHTEDRHQVTAAAADATPDFKDCSIWVLPPAVFAGSRLTRMIFRISC